MGEQPWACSMDSSLLGELDQVKPMHLLTDINFPAFQCRKRSVPPLFHILRLVFRCKVALATPCPGFTM